MPRLHSFKLLQIAAENKNFRFFYFCFRARNPFKNYFYLRFWSRGLLLFNSTAIRHGRFIICRCLQRMGYLKTRCKLHRGFDLLIFRYVYFFSSGLPWALDHIASWLKLVWQRFPLEENTPFHYACIRNVWSELPIRYARKVFYYCLAPSSSLSFTNRQYSWFFVFVYYATVYTSWAALSLSWD